MRTLLITSIFLFGSIGLACEFNSDCYGLNARCVKTIGQIYGQCLSTNNTKTQINFGSTPAQSCSFNTDCSLGKRCLKTSGSIYGVCL